jgi:DNA-binding transcriptional ArsR family regulator
MIQAVAAILDFAPKHWTPSTRIVAIALADRVNPDTLSCFPSIRDIQKRTGLGERAVQRHLRVLETEGVIKRIGQKPDGKGSWGSNIWQWHFTPTPNLWKNLRRGD